LELLEKLAAIVPLPRVHLVHYGDCLAPHSTLRAAIIPSLRQQGVDGDKAKTGTPYWNWGRLLGRVFDLDMATRPFCRRGSLRIIAAITHESVITPILRHLKLASVPPPIAPARCRQEIFAFDEAHASVVPEVTCAQQQYISPLRACEMPPSFPQDGPSRGPRPEKPLKLQRNPALSHAAPCCAPLRQAAAGRWGRHQRREPGAAAGEGGAKMPFKIPIRPLVMTLA
jgi:hypothetical protein